MVRLEELAAAPDHTDKHRHKHIDTHRQLRDRERKKCSRNRALTGCAGHGGGGGARGRGAAAARYLRQELAHVRHGLDAAIRAVEAAVAVAGPGRVRDSRTWSALTLAVGGAQVRAAASAAGGVLVSAAGATSAGQRGRSLCAALTLRHHVRLLLLLLLQLLLLEQHLLLLLLLLLLASGRGPAAAVLLVSRGRSAGLLAQARGSAGRAGPRRHGDAAIQAVAGLRTEECQDGQSRYQTAARAAGSDTHLQVGQLGIVAGARSACEVVAVAAAVGRRRHGLCREERLAAIQASRAGHVHRGHRQV